MYKNFHEITYYIVHNLAFYQRCVFFLSFSVLSHFTALDIMHGNKLKVNEEIKLTKKKSLLFQSSSAAGT